jgi:hypothetical protein
MKRPILLFSGEDYKPPPLDCYGNGTPWYLELGVTALNFQTSRAVVVKGQV